MSSQALVFQPIPSGSSVAAADARSSVLSPKQEQASTSETCIAGKRLVRSAPSEVMMLSSLDSHHSLELVRNRALRQNLLIRPRIESRHTPSFPNLGCCFASTNPPWRFVAYQQPSWLFDRTAKIPRPCSSIFPSCGTLRCMTTCCVGYFLYIICRFPTWHPSININHHDLIDAETGSFT